MSKSLEIGMRLRAARKAAKFRTACAFAKRYDIPISTYSQHENGKRVLNADILLHYSELLDVSAGWLLSGVGKPYTDCDEVSEKIAIIGRELFSLNFSIDEGPAMLPIEEDKAWIDVDLFKAVLSRFVPLLQDKCMTIPEDELINFAIEVYNGVIMTSAASADKWAMIDLSIASLKRGALKQTSTELSVLKCESA